MNSNNADLSKRQASLRGCLESLQKTMITDSNKWQQGISSSHKNQDITLYQQKLKECREIYTKANWLLIDQWFTNFQDCVRDTGRRDEIREVVNSMRIELFVESLEV